tara:strand:- start:325 stop:999 length:675 start_codon:yes stop_codon:yes gene_type:complete
VKIICIIPARKNSRRIKNKNIINFKDKPLIYHTISKAKKCREIDRVFVSTDSKLIASIAKKYGAEVPFLRPKYLSSDNVHSSKVILEHTRKIYKNTNEENIGVMMLLPTSPLIKTSSIKKCIKLFKKNINSSVIAVNKFTKNLSSLRRIRQGKLVPVFKTSNFNVQTQSEKNFIVSGSVYIISKKNLDKYKTFHINNVIPCEISEQEAIDINTHYDLKIAKINK